MPSRSAAHAAVQARDALRTALSKPKPKPKPYYEIDDPTYVRLFRALAVAKSRRSDTRVEDLSGLTPRRARYAAQLSIGLEVGLAGLVDEMHGDAIVGSELAARRAKKIPRRDVIEGVKALRKAQVGRAAGATITSAEGVFEGGSEKSVVVDFGYIRSDAEKTPQAFVRHIAELAERAASAWAQREVLVQWQRGRRSLLQRASPRGLPPPGPKLEAWLVRRRKAKR